MGKAVTVNYGHRVYSIETKCKVSSHYQSEKFGGKDHPDFHIFNAIWDTGAIMTVVSSNVVKKLGLIPRGKRLMTHANGQSFVNTYYVNILLPNNMEVQVLQVMDGYLQDTDILLGMDIIGLGDFALSAPDGNTVFSFQIPSEFLIDFIKI